MNLKKYQLGAIETLQIYLMETELYGPKHAFISVTGQPYKNEMFGDVPFVCIKIPTGGGKTLVGCHALEDIMSTFLRNKMEKGIIIWFVPSEAIKSQTLKKFKDKHDEHRKVLDQSFDNNIRIFSNEEALSIRKEDVENNLCIIICSLDAFRKERSIQKKYKVYKENGALISHFENLENDFLEKDEEGTIKNSLANVVRLSKPLIVVDEGHKSSTKLSIQFLKDLNPSFIIEYTATPKESNVLVDVSASRLKEEQMVKIPIVLESINQWSLSIDQSIKQQIELERKARKIKEEYIRPLVLIQAQPRSAVSKNITVDWVKEYLISSNIPEDNIALKTAEKNDLEGKNLFSKKCKIRYIITVSALAEGWDCSFAYILVAVANIGARIAVEQIIGRIIRMPYAKRKLNEDLNRSYIFASARNFNDAASQIISGLEGNGYTKHDLIDSKKDKPDPLKVDRRIKKDFKIPLIGLNKERLSFEDLIGEDFKISKQSEVFTLDIHFDSDGKAIIDIKEDNTWFRGEKQLPLNLTYSDKNLTKEELIQWLDKKLKYTLLDKTDKIFFSKKVVESQLKNHTLTELCINRYLLRDKLQEHIDQILESYAKKRFEKFLKDKSISTVQSDIFPESIILNELLPVGFNKSYYPIVDKLNNEEATLIDRLDLDTSPNIQFWIRNREKKDPFYISGWKKNKFYPDFVANTKKENVIALEWKGEDRISNEDTKYKEEIGRIWEKLGKGRLFFFLVHNKNVDEELSKLKLIP